MSDFNLDEKELEKQKLSQEIQQRIKKQKGIPTDEKHNLQEEIQKSLESIEKDEELTEEQLEIMEKGILDALENEVYVEEPKLPGLVYVDEDDKVKEVHEIEQVEAIEEIVEEIEPVEEIEQETMNVDLDIPKGKESVFKKIKNLFSKKEEKNTIDSMIENNNNIQDITFDDEDYEGDIVINETIDATESRKSFLSIFKKIFTKKDKKRDLDIMLKENKEQIITEELMDIPEVKKSKISELKDWFKNHKISIKDSTKSLLKCGVEGGISALSIAGCLTTASMALTIGVVPTLLITSCYVAAAATTGYLFKEELNKYKEIKKQEEVKNTHELKDLADKVTKSVKEKTKNAKEKVKSAKDNAVVKIVNAKDKVVTKAATTKDKVVTKINDVKNNMAERKELRKQEKIRKAPERFARKVKFQKLLNNALCAAGIAAYGLGAAVYIFVGLSLFMLNPTFVTFVCLLLGGLAADVSIVQAHSLIKEFDNMNGKKSLKNNALAELKTELLEADIVDSKVKNLNVNNNINVSKVRLTREEKIAKVKETCQVEKVQNLYNIFIPKEDVSLQRFVRGEIKKEYPEEKIQSFTTEDKKVLVLSKEPKLFR